MLNWLERLAHCIFPVRTSSLSITVYLQHSEKKKKKKLQTLNQLKPVIKSIFTGLL